MDDENIPFCYHSDQGFVADLQHHLWALAPISGMSVEVNPANFHITMGATAVVIGVAILRLLVFWR